MSQAPAILGLERTDAEAWLNSFGTISTVSGRLINDTSDPPLRLNVLQKRIAAVYAHAKESGTPCRVIGLKPRKKGFSTLVCALHYHQLRANRHEGVIIGDQFETSDTVYRMAQVYFDNDLMEWNSSGKYNTERFTTYDSGGNRCSILHQRTAKNPNTGRGMTPQFIHGTEVAHWQNAGPVLISIMNSIDNEVFNAVFLESTPNGAQGAFYDGWENARWPNESECPSDQLGYYKQWESMSPGGGGDALFGDRGFVRVFAAWFEFDDSVIRLDESQREHMKMTLDDEEWYAGEQTLIDLYGRTRDDGTVVLGDQVDEGDVWDQLAWRREIILTKCNKSTNIFDQEYPADPTSCFLASGSRFFDSWALAPFHTNARDPDYGSLQVQEVAGCRDKAVWVTADRDSASFMRWEHPIPGCAYLLSVDPAVGVDQTSSRNDNPDQHSALVWRRAYRNEERTFFHPALVARVAYGAPGTYPIHTFAELCYLLSVYYGRCICVPEMNNSGLAFITSAHSLGLSIWKRQEFDPNKDGKKRQMEGWQTTDTGNFGGIRTEMLNNFHKVVREEAVYIWCKHLLAEMVTFVRKSSGKVEAAATKHDDDVMCAGIGLRTLDSATTYSDAPVARQLPADLAKQIQMNRALSPPRTAENW